MNITWQSTRTRERAGNLDVRFHRIPSCKFSQAAVFAKASNTRLRVSLGQSSIAIVLGVGAGTALHFEPGLQSSRLSSHGSRGKNL